MVFSLRTGIEDDLILIDYGFSGFIFDDLIKYALLNVWWLFLEIVLLIGLMPHLIEDLLPLRVGLNLVHSINDMLRILRPLLQMFDSCFGLPLGSIVRWLVTAVVASLLELIRVALSVPFSSHVLILGGAIA